MNSDTSSFDYATSVPDTITSWIITAFSINAENGFAVTDNSVSINVFRPFFVTIILPYSIIRGESVALKVTVYNYLKIAQETQVTLINDKNEFTINTTETGGANGNSKKIVVPPNDGVTLSFILTPIKLGYISVHVEAKSQSSGDRVIEKLLVKPEGETVYKNKAFFVCMQNATNHITKHVHISIPTNASFVKHSKRVSVSAFTDILGSAINNLDDLLRMPYGCGEQNMINFVPNIVALNYLTKANKLTETVKRTAIKHLETGYQTELTYKHFDGSYSAFGQSDYFGSTWLTAFVIKSFKQSKNYISVDKNVIKEGVDFLFRKQSVDGSFIESGRVLNKAMQSGSAVNNVTLTAYVLIAVNIDDDLNSEQLSHCEKAEKFLIASLTNTSNLYEIAIISYALHLRNSSQKEIAFEKLTKFAKQTKEYIFWSNNSSMDVEINAYSLMTLVLRNETETSLSVLRWLISKQNSKGGFESTQDTVVALQALALFAEKFSSNFTDIDINVQTNKGEMKSIKVESKTGVTLYEINLKKTSKSVTLNFTGTGCTMVQVSWQYNVKNSINIPAFQIKYNASQSKHQLNKTSNILRLNVYVRTVILNESGMAVMEISLPSGFVCDVESIQSTKNELVKRVETKYSKTVIVVYFDKITLNETSISVVANREANVLNLQSVPIIVYDYYDTSKRSMILYSPKELNI
ncbi:thioester-containing protein-like protein [Leptotrombidium deliense]|uniref:Thioester-containing protein-like protein n=1 Tax=Leptotrombidium deliense TaxID=299467 RepID=A0A443S6X0_9ACAR|nr:thioester-containing protein-like protein [Leptotrombidium deliense]